MARIVLDTEDPRTIKAFALAVSGQIRPSAARGEYLVPSACTEGAFYLATTSDCTCPDRQYRSVQCKHSQAVALVELIQAAAQQPAPAPAPARLITGNGRVPRAERED